MISKLCLVIAHHTDSKLKLLPLYNILLFYGQDAPQEASAELQVTSLSAFGETT